MKKQTDQKQQIDLVINLLISGGTPFMSFLMGLFSKEVWFLPILGFAYIGTLNSIQLIKLLSNCKSKAVKEGVSFFIMTNVAIPVIAFFTGENSLGSTLSVVVLTALTMINCGIFYSVYSKDSLNSPSLLRMRLQNKCEDHD